jgi:hypothetical protein
LTIARGRSSLQNPEDLCRYSRCNSSGLSGSARRDACCKECWLFFASRPLVVAIERFAQHRRASLPHPRRKRRQKKLCRPLVSINSFCRTIAPRNTLPNPTLASIIGSTAIIHVWRKSWNRIRRDPAHSRHFRTHHPHWWRHAGLPAPLLQSRWHGQHSGLVPVGNRGLGTQTDVLVEPLSFGGAHHFEVTITVAAGATVVIRVTDGNDRQIDNGKIAPDRQQITAGVVDHPSRAKCCVSTQCASKQNEPGAHIPKGLSLCAYCGAFSPEHCLCRVVTTLDEQCPLGASWAFSLQPMLPVSRPLVLRNRDGRLPMYKAFPRC